MFMNKQICQKCGREIANEFGVTLSFCTNCGAAVNNLIDEKTVELKTNFSGNTKPKSHLISGLILGAVTTVFLLGGIYFLTTYFSDAQSKSVSSDGKPVEKSSPWIKLPGLNSVSASEIMTVAFSVRSHYGPLVGSDESYTTSGATSFSNDGTALKTSGVKSYDTRKKEGSEGQKFQGVVSKEQFQKLAQTLADNDFSNLEDSTERISDTTSYTLIVTYSGKTKTIMTSNTGKDTAEIKEILDAFESLKNQIDWKQSQ